MPDILPPQLVGVQQRPLYVKVRTALTVISSIWLLMAITGFGFFSGGTTSLALSLVLLYGTGAALIVVIAAVYRLVKNSAVKRSETAPDDTAAVVFVDTARSATEELLAALRPAAATGRPAAESPRTVRAAASEAPEGTTAAAKPSAGKVSGTKLQTQKQPAKGVKAPSATGTQAGSAKGAAAAKGTAAVKVATAAKGAAAVKVATAARSGKTSASAQQASAPKQKTGPAKTAPKSALNKAVPNKSAAGKPGPGKTAPVKSAQRTKASSKAPQGRTTQAKGRPANNSGSVSAPAKRTGSSANRQPGKKQPGAKDSSAGPVGPGDHCSAPQKPSRPALVLASSNTMPQQRQQHVPDSRKRAS